MKCSEIRSELSFYSDDILSAEQRSSVEAHLDVCPVCRAELADLQGLRNELRSLSRPRMPGSVTASIRNALASRLAPTGPGPVFRLVEDRRRWSEAWLMPSVVGTFASVIFAVALVWTMVSTSPNRADLMIASANNGYSTQNSGIGTSPGISGPESLDLTPYQYAGLRRSVSGESPSINPQGALVALTRSLVRGKMEDEEVVVVADVFGNGLARIAEVIEPTNDDRAVEELEKALDSDPTYAPFVPAEYDRRSETTRVVFKIRNVVVKTYLEAPKPSPERRRS